MVTDVENAKSVAGNFLRKCKQGACVRLLSSLHDQVVAAHHHRRLLLSPASPPAQKPSRGKVIDED